MKKMNTKTTLSITEARKKIFKIAEDVQKPSNYYTLTEKGRAKAVIMSANDFESWQETMEVMRDFPDIKKDIEDAENDYKTGNYITLDELLKKEGYVLADKGKKQYGIQNRSSKKGSKRPRQNR
ncbi:MAG: type II toxin-antitoxin system Phd/YefM family antitoxin [bacterium]|nr:type II toxin-antitoxin system Phd/YefM family antitoxin [bacterium]